MADEQLARIGKYYRFQTHEGLNAYIRASWTNGHGALLGFGWRHCEGRKVLISEYFPCETDARDFTEISQDAFNDAWSLIASLKPNYLPSHEKEPPNYRCKQCKTPLENEGSFSTFVCGHMDERVNITNLIEPI